MEGLPWNVGSVLRAVQSRTFGAEDFSPSRKVVLRLVWEEISLEARKQEEAVSLVRRTV